MKRVMVTITGQGAISAIIRTGILYEMRKFCTPIVGILWEQNDLINELKNDGFEVYILPPIKFSSQYSLLRNQINFGFLYFILKTPSTEISSKYKRHFISQRKRIKQLYNKTFTYIKFLLNPRLYKRLISQEEILIKEEESYNVYKQWLSTNNIDGIFTVTPFLFEAEVAARILQEQNKITVAAIHSFDNVTKRNWSPVSFDNYSVWNTYNKNELLRIFAKLKPENIVINGAPQFDFHFNKDFLLQEMEWRNLLGIKSQSKIILYAGGWSGLTPNEDQYIRHIMEAIHNGKIQGHPILLLRSHPLDTVDRWRNILREYPEILMDDIKQGDKKFDFSNLTKTDLKKFCSTLQYSDVHVNLCSTMAIDGAAHNKPQIAPYYDTIKAQQDLRNLYHQEHYLPVIKSGGLIMAKSPAELQEYINKGLHEPSSFLSNQLSMLNEVITYNDGNTKDRMLKYLAKNFI